MNIVIEGISLSLDLLKGQKYRNLEVIPIRINNSANLELLTLKRGMDIGVVELSECEVSTVGTVLARNNANIPLVLIDGDEIIGAKQNRIMNRSLIVPPKTTLPISVSCTEQGRWHYGRSGPITRDFENADDIEDYIHYHDVGDGMFENFDCSDYFADFSTRREKSRDLFDEKACQSTVWDSISMLEERTSFKSHTGALHDNFENHRALQNEYLKHFKLEFGQSGAIFIIDGQIKGLELFANSTIYMDYHEKIFRSYIMEAIVEGPTISNCHISRFDIKKFLMEINCSQYKRSENNGIGKHFKFANTHGVGAALFDGNNLVHLVYFNKHQSNQMNVGRNTRRYGTFGDFALDFE